MLLDCYSQKFINVGLGKTIGIHLVANPQNSPRQMLMLQGGRIDTPIPLEGCMTKEPLGGVYFFFSVFL